MKGFLSSVFIYIYIFRLFIILLFYEYFHVKKIFCAHVKSDSKTVCDFLLITKREEFKNKINYAKAASLEIHNGTISEGTYLILFLFLL